MIKKILSILTLLFTLTMPANAINPDFAQMCPVSPHKSNITPSKIIGANWLTEKIAQSIIRKELKKETKGKFKVNIDSRSMSDLMKGEFTYLSMVGTNLNIDGTQISKFSSHTVCEYNAVKLNKDSIEFKENMVLNYEIEIDNNSLTQTLVNSGYVDTLKKIRIPMLNYGVGSINLAKVSNATIAMKNNKLNFIYEISTPLSSKPLTINLASGVKVKGGKVQLAGIQQTSKNSFINSGKLISILNKTNPLAFTSEIMNNKNSQVYVDSVNIVNDVMHIKGLVLIPKNVIIK